MKLLTPESKVGVFVIVIATLTLMMTFRISKIKIFDRAAEKEIYVYFSSISGVEEKSAVKLAGVRIGNIKQIDLDGGRARIVIQIERKVDIPANSIATIRTEGLLGEKYIELIYGTDTSKMIANGETLKNTLEPTDVNDLINKVANAMTDITVITKSLKNILADDEAAGTKGVIPSIVANIEKLTASLDSSMSVIGDNREAISASLRSMQTLLAALADKLPAMVDNAKELTAKLDSAMGSVERIAKQVEKGEGTVGKLVTQDELYNNLNDTLASAQSLVGKAETLTLDVGFRSESVQGTDNLTSDNRAIVSVKVQPKEDKYYLAEVQQNYRSNKAIASNAFSDVMYTAMIGKKFSDLDLRVGFIESSGGVGMKYRLLGDTASLRADLFNFSGYDSNAKKPQLKVSGEVRFLDYLFVYGGGDELFNSYYRNYYVGGGLSFTDDDIKLILGKF